MVAKTLMQFFLDGYDTLGTSISLAFYFLATHPDVQEKAIEEVDEIAGKCDVSLGADDISELKYLEQVFNEAGRIAPFPWTFRACTKNWTLPGNPNVMIPKGMRVMIPIYAVHVRITKCGS